MAAGFPQVVFLFSTWEVEKKTPLSQARFHREFGKNGDTTPLKSRNGYRLELMLVLISFTVSAKAGSFFIFVSIWRRE